MAQKIIEPDQHRQAQATGNEIIGKLAKIEFDTLVHGRGRRLRGPRH